MTFLDFIIGVVWVYIAGAAIIGTLYFFTYLSARRRGVIVSETPVSDIAITAALWPAFIAFMINKMIERRKD